MNEHPSGITVTGEGRASSAPDRATLSLGVSSLRKSVAEAREDAALALQSMIDALTAAGVTSADIQTRRLSVSPEYDYDKGRQRPRGFRVSNTLTITLRDIDRTSEVIDAALAAGGDAALLHGIAFEVEQAEKLQESARTAAVADAHRKAETLARAAGVTLGTALRVVEQPSPPDHAPVLRSMALASVAESAPTPVSPGEIEVVVNVTATWTIIAAT